LFPKESYHINVRIESIYPYTVIIIVDFDRLNVLIEVASVKQPNMNFMVVKFLRYKHFEEY
jgi:hypothetical protein